MRVLFGFIVSACLCASVIAQTATISGTIIIEQKGRAVADRSGAVVWLTPVGRTVDPARPTHIYHLTQKDKHFDPHLLVVPQGAEVEFPNKDPFFHNVFSLHDGVRFDLGLYEGGSSKTVRFSRPGASYIFCNIHPEMSAVILVMSTPYYATTDNTGNYRIADVPAGEYQLSVWYERAQTEQLKSLSKKISVAGNATLDTIKITQAPGLAEHHKNKFGQDYEPEANYKLP